MATSPAPLRPNERVLALASWNMQRGHKLEQIVDDFDRLLDRFDRPDLFGCQEAYEYVGGFAEAAWDRGYRILIPPFPLGDGIPVRGFNAANPILVRADSLRPRRVDLIPVHGGKAGAYPGRIITAGSFDWTAGDGSTISYDNTHLNSAIDKGGHPSGLPRVALSTDHLRKLAADAVTRAAGPDLAFLGGDLNVDEHDDNRVDWSGFPNQIFREAGILSVYDELGTPESFRTLSGGRTVDVVASVNRDSRVRALEVLSAYGLKLATDHYPVCARYAVGMTARVAS